MTFCVECKKIKLFLFVYKQLKVYSGVILSIFLLDALLAVMGHFSPGLLGYCGDAAPLQVQRRGRVGKRAVRSHVVSDKTGSEHQQHHQHPPPR